MINTVFAKRKYESCSGKKKYFRRVLKNGMVDKK
jgi:hypothetical protein